MFKKKLSGFEFSILFFLAITSLAACFGIKKAGDYRGEFIKDKLMPTSDTLQKWNASKAKLGPAFSGSPSWKKNMKFLEKRFKDYGLVDIKKDRFSYNRWFTSDERKNNDWSLSVNGQEIYVASYWAYSGATDSQGITAPLVYYNPKDTKVSIEGKIVVFDIPPLTEPLLTMFKTTGFEYSTDDDTPAKDTFSLEHWYQVNYATRFGGFKEILEKGKASGAIVIFDMAPARADGLYTFPLPNSEVGVPGLYLDREAGKVIKHAAVEGKKATLRLMAKKEKTETYFFSGFLPGKNYGKESDETVLLITHSDGPNISQENGGLGILGLIEYFSHIPQNERKRTLLVILDPQHYMPGRHQVSWYDLHPDIAKKIVASIGIEHLGQVEYTEREGNYIPTGKPEVTQLLVQDNDLLIKKAVNAVKDCNLPRTMVQCPSRKGQGRWYGMGEVATERNIPGYAISGSMGAYWTTKAGIDKFDKGLMWKQVAVAVELTNLLMNADIKDIAVNKKEN